MNPATAASVDASGTRGSALHVSIDAGGTALTVTGLLLPPHAAKDVTHPRANIARIPIPHRIAHFPIV